MKLLNGISELLQSPSGVFALLCLGIMTWKAAVLGAGVFIAFFGVVPAILAYVEHKEQLQLNAQADQSNSLHLPPRGQ